MKKKIKSKKKRQQKIDVVLASLLNLETQTRELIKRMDNLERKIPNFPIYDPPKWYPEQPIVWW